MANKIKREGKVYIPSSLLKTVLPTRFDTKGQQVDYVLGEWNRQEIETIEPRIPVAVEIIKSFVSIGIERTMTFYNNK
jgi:peptidyl-tRNA hydrolase